MQKKLAPAAGLEPATYWLTANRSTIELRRNRKRGHYTKRGGGVKRKKDGKRKKRKGATSWEKTAENQGLGMDLHAGQSMLRFFPDRDATGLSSGRGAEKAYFLERKEEGG